MYSKVCDRYLGSIPLLYSFEPDYKYDRKVDLPDAPNIQSSVSNSVLCFFSVGTSPFISSEPMVTYSIAHTTY